MSLQTAVVPNALSAGGAHSWADLPADLLRLVFRDLRIQAAGGCALRDAARLWLAVARACRPWRTVAAGEIRFHVRLEAGDWDCGAPTLARRLAALPVAELSLPSQPLLGYEDPNFSSGFDMKHAMNVAGLLIHQARLAAVPHPGRVPLRALHGLLPQAVAERLLSRWTDLQRLSLAGGLPNGGGSDMPAFPPGVFPPSLQQLDMPVPRHPFRIGGRLPHTLTAITLRCDQDFLLTRDALGSNGGGSGRAEDVPGGPYAYEGALPPSWRQLAVHAGRTAGTDLDDLFRLPPLLDASSSGGGAAPGGSTVPLAAAEAASPQRSLVLAAPQVMLSTADPSVPAQLAAPPVRSLEVTLAQHLAVLAPVLAAARLARLCIVAGEASFYCRRPGRLGIIDAAALPPAGRVQAAHSVLGYTAALAWPAGAPGGGGAGAGAQQAPSFELCFTYSA
ncbi:hypothetical protein ABPG75_008944 [Micractinium tetrahymenae]